MGKNRWGSKLVATAGATEPSGGRPPEDEEAGALSGALRPNDLERDGVAVLDTHRRLAKVGTKRTQPAGAGARALRGSRSDKIGEHIGQELRDLYNNVLSQPIPDRFLELLNKLEGGAISSREHGKKAPEEH